MSIDIAPGRRPLLPPAWSISGVAILGEPQVPRNRSDVLRCLRTSKSMMPVATETLRLDTLPAIGIDTT